MMWSVLIIFLGERGRNRFCKRLYSIRGKHKVDGTIREPESGGIDRAVRTCDQSFWPDSFSASPFAKVSEERTFQNEFCCLREESGHHMTALRLFLD